MTKQKEKIIVVCGPTGTGKTNLAVMLCKVFGGQVIGADSMQIYEGLTIGTAAPKPGEVKQYLVGFVPPEKAFSVADWLDEATKAVEQITMYGDIPIVCGGTGLYINSLVNGISFTEEKTDTVLRESLYSSWDALGAEAMWQKLYECDPKCAEKLHKNDRKRIIRALELCKLTGKSEKERSECSKPNEKPYDALVLGLNYRDRAKLYKAIDARVDRMMDAGLLGEAKKVWQNKEEYITAAQAIGYKEFFMYFEGSAKLEECVQKLKQATRNYAKRQLTWFRHMQDVNWIYVDDDAVSERAIAFVTAWLQPA